MIHYAWNFGGLGSFSPLKIRSAPTFFPSLGHPYFDPKRLCIMPQEGRMEPSRVRVRKNVIVFRAFIGLADIKINVNKPTTIIQHLQ
jgi:hypothetical protein